MKIVNELKNKLKGLASIKESQLQILLIVIIIFLVNIAMNVAPVRFDLTRNRSFSLTNKSKEVVSTLQERLKIRILFSHNLPAQHESIYRYIKDMLAEYKEHGNKHFSYEIVEEERLKEAASDFGMQPVQSQEYIDDQVKVRQTYMGLVIQHADLIEKIDQVTDTTGLEFKITSLIQKMSGKIGGLLALKNPIEVRLYTDENLLKLPITGINNLQQTVQEIVKRAGERNYNKLSFKSLSSSDSSRSGNLLKMYGLNKLSWKRSTKVPGGSAVFGIVVTKGKRFKTINLNVAPGLFGSYAVTGLENLEDDINQAVAGLLSVSQKVAYVTGHGEVNLADNRTAEGGALFKEILSDTYEVVTLDLKKDSIPPGVECVIINGPEGDFTKEELYKLDQFLLRGNSLLVFRDSFKEQQVPPQMRRFMQQQPPVSVRTNIDKLLAHYGITVNQDIVLDSESTQVNTGTGIIDYPLIPLISRNGLSSEHTSTSYLRSIAFMKSASLSFDEKSENIKAIVSSSPKSWLMVEKVNFNPMFMTPLAEDTMKSYPLAVSFKGHLKSYFGNAYTGISKKQSIKGTSHLSTTLEKRRSRVLVVGTTSVTRSGFILDARKILSRGRVQSVYSNEIFLHSLVDSLSGNGHIPEMKSKNLDINPLDQTAPGTRFSLKVLNTAGIPAFIILFGFLAWQRRRGRQRLIEAKFKKRGAIHE